MTMLLQSLKIRSLLVLGFSFTLVITLVIAIVGGVALQSVVDRVDKADDANRIIKQVLALRLAEKNFVLAGKTEQQQEVVHTLALIQSQLDETSGQFTDSENLDQLTELNNNIALYRRAFTALTLADTNAKLKRTEMEQLAQQLEQDLNKFRALQKKQVQQLLASGADISAVTDELNEADNANRLIKYLLDTRRDEKNMLLGNNEVAAKQVRAGLSDASQLADSILQNTERQDSKQVVQQVIEGWQRYANAFNAFYQYYSERQQLDRQLTDSARTLVDTAEALRADQRNELDRDTGFSYQLLLLGGTAALVISALVAWLLIRVITKPLKHVYKAMLDVAQGEGDLTRRLPVKGKNELALLAGAFNEFAEKMRSAIETVAGKVMQLSSASEELSVTSDQSSEAIQQQRLQTDSLAAAMEQMAATTMEVARNIASSNVMAEEAKQQADAGTEIVSNSVQQVHNVALQITQAAEIVKQLATQAQGVSSVLDVINSLADQTNLLALNAAIEAARAGENGRGFAVVASEVRVLAGKTQSSAAEIRDMIEQLEQSAKQSVEVMQNCANGTGQATTLSQQSGQALSSISDSINDMLDVSTQIASAAEQQRATTEDMNRNTQMIRDLATQNADAIKQTSATTRELAGMAEELQVMTGQFRIN
ncbi:Methyl-accepting chemotaxis protein [Arsukibacterium tuosuense]|uniref:Methyl-accepting chemotaxis protein n=1 Tax=Arsukibacterium tuosuense TaxID=1323745 RepID=A0A285ID61_9GAMM|nr:methyl-accepting chemotaxis protein [Arsukibacterium tuosuense]SNY45910.1 Methyl-accepting chemotaxis protein [Arsukibacterium tuosuense]